MPEVKIYSTTHCPYCQLAKNYFAKNNIPYTEINVQGDESAQKEMLDKSGSIEVPVFDIGGTIIQGFKKGEIDKLIGLAV